MSASSVTLVEVTPRSLPLPVSYPFSTVRSCLALFQGHKVFQPALDMIHSLRRHGSVSNCGLVAPVWNTCLSQSGNSTLENVRSYSSRKDYSYRVALPSLKGDTKQ